jgi:hypothetical protein
LRGSSPKLQVLNNALITAQNPQRFAETRPQGDLWGRLVESCVGTHLLNTSLGTAIEVVYWRERNQEVDFVLRKGTRVVAIEVKSGRRRESLAGMDAFVRQYQPQRQLPVGAQGIPLECFLSQPKPPIRARPRHPRWTLPRRHLRTFLAKPDSPSRPHDHD